MTPPASATVPWHLDKGRARGEMGYLPGLDGVRALAVLGVLLYHADATWLGGGFLGVDVFFVLSGFLITSLILEEFDRSGRVDFAKFYLGRARRLLPALLLMLAAVAIAVAFFYRDAAAQTRQDIVASLFYVNNWWYVLADQSYFEAIGRPPVLKHLWSLAVEEQFYLAWPAIAFLVMKSGGRRGLRLLAIALAIMSTTWMLVLSVRNGYPELADPSRAYFGTDSHAMGLLIGAALATFWRPGRLSAQVSTGARGVIMATGIGSLVAILWFFVFVTEYTPWLYRGGFLVLALLVALLIAMATHPAVTLGTWLGTQPLRYIGQRSYGLYLWHWPIFMVTRPGLDLPLDGLPLFVLRMALTFGIAELSYRFIEMPIRRGAIDRWVAAWKTAAGPDRSRLTRRAGMILGPTIAAVVLVGAVMSTAPAPSAAEGLPDDVAAAIGIDDGGPTEVSIDDPSPPLPSPGASASGSTDSQGTATRDPNDRSRNGTLSAIGDSVMLGARSTIYDVIPGAKVDAAVSRMPGAFVGRIKKLAGKNKLADTVVLHPTTNGLLTEDMLRSMLNRLEDYPRVVVVNAAVPRNWERPNNKVIDSVVPDYPNAVIADWNSAADGHPEYFVSDGIHLTGPGARAYAKLIKKTAGV